MTEFKTTTAFRISVAGGWYSAIPQSPFLTRTIPFRCDLFLDNIVSVRIDVEIFIHEMEMSMDDQLKRANRRAAQCKAKARALRRYIYQVGRSLQPLQPPCTERMAGKLAHTRTPCSCPQCGNPRKYSKENSLLTMVENRQLLREMSW